MKESTALEGLAANAIAVLDTNPEGVQLVLSKLCEVMRYFSGVF